MTEWTTADALSSNWETFKWLLYGASGTGKTTSLRTFPRNKDGSSKLCIVDCEQRIGSLRGLDIPVISLTEPNPGKEPRQWRDFENAWDKLRNHGLPDGCDVVAIESLTALADAGLRECMRLNNRLGRMSRPVKPEENMTQTEWGVLIGTIDEILEEMKSAPFGVILTAHTMITQDELTKSVLQRVLMYGKSLPEKTPTRFDEVYYTMTKDKPGEAPEYLWRIKPSNKIMSARSSLMSEDTVTHPQDFTAVLKEAGCDV